MQKQKAHGKVGRPQSMPTGDTPMAEFIRAYHKKHGEMLSIDEIAEAMGVARRSVERWKAGKRKMGGSALVLLNRLKEKYL